MKTKSFIFLFTPMALSTCLIACQQTKELHEMHDTTQKMSNTTQDMSQTTKGMSATTDQMNDKMGTMITKTDTLGKTSDSMDAKMSKVIEATNNTLKMMGEVYDSGRQAAALDLRKKHLETIMATPKTDEKLAYAGAYFEAFEFQLWSNLGQDANPGAQEALAQDAVKEFFFHIQTVSHWASSDIDIFAPNPLNPSFGVFQAKDVENEKAVFNIMAAALDEKNRKQVHVPEDPNSKGTSMYTLIRDSLLAGQQVRLGKKRIEDYPDYVDTVLQTEELATRLLRDRFNMLGLVLLGHLTSVTDDLWQGLKFKELHSAWTLDMDQMNVSQLKYYRAHVTEALETYEVLRQLGVDVKLDKNLKAIYQNMTIKGGLIAGEAKSNPESYTAKIALRKSLTDYLTH